MPFSAQPPASGERYALSASLDNARHLSSLLRAVHFQDHATCLATASGLRVTVEDAKCIQANAFIQLIPNPKGWIYVNCERLRFYKHFIEDGCAVLRALQDSVFPLGCQEDMKLLFQKCHKAVSASDKQDSIEQFTPIKLVKCKIQHMFQRVKTHFSVLSCSCVLLVFGMFIHALSIKNAEIFQEFSVQEESVMFRISLSVLLDCLTIFGTSSLPGTSTALRMCYQGYGYPLMLFLEEGGVVTVCKINTQEPDELLDFDFCSTKVVNKIILQSEGLREAFAELDMTSEVLQITMSPDKPYFRLSTFGNAGSAHLDYPRDSDLMEAFHCNQTQTNRYKISLLKPSTKALALSCKVSIRTDAQGFLSLQYMIRNEDGQICFVEYYCCPDENITEAEL